MALNWPPGLVTLPSVTSLDLLREAARQPSLLKFHAALSTLVAMNSLALTFPNNHTALYGPLRFCLTPALPKGHRGRRARKAAFAHMARKLRRALAEARERDA